MIGSPISSGRPSNADTTAIYGYFEESQPMNSDFKRPAELDNSLIVMEEQIEARERNQYRNKLD